MRSVVGVLSLLAIGCGTATANESSRSTPTEGSSPVLVEIFTSQGCSSCPPGDALLAQLADDPELDIIPLAFHVDYWNYIGWRDPFSSSAWSDRQRAYAAARNSRRIYTPQLLFNGRDHAVGTNRSQAQKAIAQQRPQTTVVVAVEAKQQRDKIHVSVVATAEAEVSSEDTAVFVALVQDEATTKVRSGENASKTLRNAFIVHELVEACTFASGESCETSFDTPSFEAHVVAWAQSAADMRVLGSGLATP